MRITDIIMEDIPPELKNVTVAQFGDTPVTVGDVQDVLPNVDPHTIIKYGSKINDFLQTKIGGNYTVGKALVDVGSIIPVARRYKNLKTLGGAAKELGKYELRRELGHAAADQVDIMPTPKGFDSGFESKKSDAEPNKSKKNRLKVGDKIKVIVDSKSYMLPIKIVLNNGYAVDASKVPGKQKGATITVSEPV